TQEYCSAVVKDIERLEKYIMLDTRLTQNLNQRLILSPQMITSMRLLTLPITELRSYLENQMIENPLLEIDAQKDDSSTTIEAEEESNQRDDTPEPLATNEELDFKEQFDILNRLDEEWRENFFKSIAPVNRAETERKRDYRLSLITKHHSLYDHLTEQLALTDLNPKERIIAENIIGNIDDNGYLQAEIEEIAQASQAAVTKVKTILALIQKFDPPGIGARDLRETLLIQLEYLEEDKSLAYCIIKDCFEDFYKKRFAKIAGKLKKDPGEIEQAKQKICRLEPKPGRLFGESRPQIINPDIILEKKDDDYIITLNNNDIPKLKINKYYKALIKKDNISPETEEFIKNRFKAAFGLIKGVAQRQSTILKIAREIVAHQKDFLEKGQDYLKPLNLKEIAQKINMHESTVSRAITNKYMQTDNGLLCMKDFFNTKFKDKNGCLQSQVSIKEKIANLIKEEDSSCPLTDDNIVQLLSKEGINIARRTAAKYRDTAGILPSSLRKIS
ncbi:MAG: RNA polymerase factor sigma-54, partial [Candidatus Omnitrophica bacterium]|nr:RNA polymerase factor sigma-54 [Candidatus Omnitrophota bacterium]